MHLWLWQDLGPGGLCASRPRRRPLLVAEPGARRANRKLVILQRGKQLGQGLPPKHEPGFLGRGRQRDNVPCALTQDRAFADDLLVRLSA
jgi:hypothetical protein